MLIKQIQFTNCTEEELELIPDFMEWLKENYYLSDLVGDERVSDDLTTSYLIDEINYVLNND